MFEIYGRFGIEDNTGKSEYPFWVYLDNGFEFVVHEYFKTYEDALEYVHLHMGES